jgi:hypothetical protein
MNQRFAQRLTGSMVSALPSDVRRGSALPSALVKRSGLCPWFRLRPWGAAPNEGSPLRRGIASPHIRWRSRKEQVPR